MAKNRICALNVVENLVNLCDMLQVFNDESNITIRLRASTNIAEEYFAFSMYYHLYCEARKTVTTYHLIAFGCIFKVIFLVFVEAKPNHDIQFGLDRPALGTISSLARELNKSNNIS